MNGRKALREVKATEIDRDVTDDTTLVLRAQSGDTLAFEKLVDKYDRRVLSLAFSYTRNSDDAKDIYQETLIRAFYSIKRFKMKSEFSTWLYRIASNVCISFNYRQKRKAQVIVKNSPEDGDLADPGTTAFSSVESDLLSSEVAKLIEQALTKLSPMQRLVFTMKHYEGYLLREIALFTKSSEGTVKKHLYVAVRRLQDELRDVVK